MTIYLAPRQLSRRVPPRRDDVAIGVKRPTRGRAGHPLSPYSALLQVGFDRHCVAAADRTLLPSDFTLTASFASLLVASRLHLRTCRRYVSVPLSVPRSSVATATEAWALPSTLSGGARTFLPSDNSERRSPSLLVLP